MKYLLPLVFVLLSCGSTIQSASRATLEQAARALVSFDTISSVAYRQAAASHLGEAETLTEYEALMQPWDQLESDLRTENRHLLDAQNGLFQWELDDHPDDFNKAMACVSFYMRKIVQRMDELHISYNVSVSASVARQLSLWSSSECHESEK